MIMFKLQNMTIKQKLTAIIMLTCAVILLLAITVLVIWGQIETRRHLVDDLKSHADIIADNCKASLAFSDKEDAKQVLSALQNRHSIVFACICDKQGRVFVEYQRKDMTEKSRPPECQKTGHAFENGYLSMFRHIYLDGEIIGTVCLQDDMRLARSMLTRNIVVAVVVLPLVLAIAYFIASKIQKVVSGLAGILNLQDPWQWLVVDILFG